MGIQTVYPDEEQQRMVMSLVYDYVKKGVADIPEGIREGMQNMIGDLGKQGAEVLILASTEFPIAFNIMGLRSDAFVDPTIILAKAAIRMAGANVRESAENNK
jgi:aspartate racemase